MHKKRVSETHKQKTLTASMAEGTIVQKQLELGMTNDADGVAFIGADEDYAMLLAKRDRR